MRSATFTLAIALSLLPAAAGAQSVSDGSSCATHEDGGGPFEWLENLFHLDHDGGSSSPSAPPAPVSCKAESASLAALWSEPSLSPAQTDSLRQDLAKVAGDEKAVAAAQAALDAAMSRALWAQIFGGSSPASLLTPPLVHTDGKSALADERAASAALALAQQKLDHDRIAAAQASLLLAVKGNLAGSASRSQDRLASLEQELAHAKSEQQRADAWRALDGAEGPLRADAAVPDPNQQLAYLQQRGFCGPGVALPSSDAWSSNQSALSGLLATAGQASASGLDALAIAANPTWAADNAKDLRRGMEPGPGMTSRTSEALLRGKPFAEIRHDEDVRYRQTPGVGERHRGEIALIVDGAFAKEHPHQRPSNAIRDRAMSAAMEAWKRGADTAEIAKAAKEAWPNVSRNVRQFYMQQPTEWQCAPTSLTMAEAAWGVAPSNAHTLARLTRELADSPVYGLPGNASLVADQARRDGLQAVYNPSPEASQVRRALEDGRTVVLNGSLGVGGHFIYVAGLNKDGTFIIADPFRPDVTRMNDAELNHFTHDGPNPPGFAEIWK